MRLAHFVAHISALVVALGVATLTALPAQAQIARYECRMGALDGVSGLERNQRAARRAAQDAWEARARSAHAFNYRWNRAQVVAARTFTRSEGGRWVGYAQAYPCRIYVDVPRGTLTDGTETAAQRACMGFPSFETAQHNNCRFFYPLRR